MTRVISLCSIVALTTLGVGCDNRGPGTTGSSPPTPSTTLTDGRANEVTIRGERFSARLFAFALSKFDLTIRDAAMKRDLVPLLEGPEDQLVVNGGFFDRQDRPVGLLEGRGVRISLLASELSGGVFVVDNDHAALFETETYPAASSHAFAIQCKPRLVVGGAMYIRSDDGQRARRTVLCARGGGSEIVVGTLIAGESGPSLIASAELLRNIGCEAALNLDGGPSTGMAWKENAQVKFLEPLGPVRYTLVVRSKKS